MIYIYLKKRMSPQFYSSLKSIIKNGFFKVLRRRLIIKICFFSETDISLLPPLAVSGLCKNYQNAPKNQESKKKPKLPLSDFNLGNRS